LGLIAIAVVGAVAFLFSAKAAAASGQPFARDNAPPQFQAAALRLESGEYRTNFTQTIPLDANGRFNIDNANGRTEIRGWSSNAVVFTAAIHGKTPESVEAVRVRIDSDSKHVGVHTEDLLDKPGSSSFWDWLKYGLRDKATVDYTVHVPESAQLKDVNSVNGQVDISGVAGDINVSTVNGETKIKDAARNLKLDTVNGSITAEMVSLGGGQKVSLDAVNGELVLAVPEDADAKFNINTVNGEISSEFSSLQPKKEWPTGHDLNGSLGRGSGSVKADAVNGTVKIVKRPAAKIEVESPSPK
jgi:hypothetical protein